MIERILDKIPLPIMLGICVAGAFAGIYCYALASRDMAADNDLLEWRKTCVLENLKNHIPESVAIDSCKALEEQYLRLRSHSWQ
jgi:hypothetical protein